MCVLLWFNFCVERSRFCAKCFKFRYDKLLRNDYVYTYDDETSSIVCIGKRQFTRRRNIANDNEATGMNNRGREHKTFREQTDSRHRERERWSWEYWLAGAWPSYHGTFRDCINTLTIMTYYTIYSNTILFYYVRLGQTINRRSNTTEDIHAYTHWKRVFKQVCSNKNLLSTKRQKLLDCKDNVASLWTLLKHVRKSTQCRTLSSAISIQDWYNYFRSFFIRC